VEACHLERRTPFPHWAVWASVVSRPEGKANEPKYTIPSDSYGPTVMIWAYVDGRGAQKYSTFKGNVSSKTYTSMLNRTLLPYIKTLQARKQPFVFMQDHATPHTAGATKKWLADRNVTMLPWIAKGADLNPIENVWSMLAHEVERERPRNSAEMEQAIDMAWQRINPKVIDRVISTMPNRVKQVIRRKGLSCDY